MKLKILIYGFLFMFFVLGCGKTVIDPLPLTQKQPVSAKLKSATIGTYYVSPTGSNKNPGTESQPFLTAAYAASLAKPGDIVIFEDGIYTGTLGNFFATLSRSGTSSDYITYRARNKGKAILDGQDNSALAAFSIPGGTSYINISGFNIKGMKGVGIEVRDGASYINFSDLNIHDIGRQVTQIGDGSGITIGNSNYMVIERCLFHDLGAYAPGENGATYPAGYTGYQTLYHGVYLAGTSHVTIKNNAFYNINEGFAIQFYSEEGDPSSYVDIINNTFENGNRWQNGGHITLCNTISNILIANNIFKDQYSYAINVLNYGYTYSSVTVTKNMTSGGNGKIITGSISGVTISDNYNSTDPLFNNEETHDFSLKSNSPAAITGYNTGLTTDYLNNARTTINIGAYGSFSSAPASVSATTTTTTNYYNTQTSATATKNDCGTGYTGSSVTYVVAANKYSSTLSQADADDEATADLNANKQTYANENGNCTNAETTVYYNIKITGTATKNDCGEGYVGSRINYVVLANTYSSTVSQGDADAQAIAYVDAQKQRNANEHGYCRPIR